MKKFLFPENQRFYRANMHCHSNLSDGRLTPQELKRIYKEEGYSVLCITDHDYFVPHNDLSDEDFLLINGYEYSIKSGPTTGLRAKTCHVNLYAKDPNQTAHVCFDPEDRYINKYAPKEVIPTLPYVGEIFERSYNIPCMNTVIKTAVENGFLVCYNHPEWSLEEEAEYTGYTGMFAMEIYNNGCSVSSGLDNDNGQIYDTMLRTGKRIACIAADDNHNIHPRESDHWDSFGGYIMIAAPKLSYAAVIEALEKKNFYASTGAVIKNLYTEDGKIFVECEGNCRVRFKTIGRRAGVVYLKDGETTASFKLHPEDEYVRITVENKNGQKAFTRAYFIDELLAD